MKCSINSTSISEGIKEKANSELSDSKLFSVKDEVYSPKDETSDYQAVIDRVNNSFNEEIVMSLNQEDPLFTVVEPSPKLISTYENILTEEVPEVASTLSPEQQAIVDKLVKQDLITLDEDVIRIPNLRGGKDFEKAEILQEYLDTKQVDFLHIEETMNDFIVQAGYKEKVEGPTASKTEVRKAAPITKRRVLTFLENVGFRDVATVQDIVHNGKVIDANAIIDFGKQMMQIREGNEDVALPEESMHILMKLVQQSRPQLYRDLTKDVVNYQLYRDLLTDPTYTNNSEYRDEDGNLDYAKLKEEAAAKLLAEFLINKLQEESPQRVAKVYNFWQSILNWVKQLFGQYKNPFLDVLDELDENDKAFGIVQDINSSDVFYSMKSTEQRDEENPDNRGIFDSINSRPSKENIYKEDSSYYKAGEKIDDKNRVTYLVDEFYKKLFGNRNFDESLEAFYEQSRQDGSFIHEIFDATISSYIDKTTGLIKVSPTAMEFPLNTPLQRDIYKRINTFIKGTLSGYKEGTRFIAEQIVYDPTANRYGTIDFLAIAPDGTVDILDWKSLLLPTSEGVKDYKKGGFNVQLNEYKRILKDSYGVTKFGKIRAIPIKKYYKKNEEGVQELKGIEIGSSNPSNIGTDKKYLRPIISEEESTGSDNKDELVKKLGALYQRYIDKGYFKEERNILSDIEEAIYEIRISNNVQNLTSYFTDLKKKFEDLRDQAPNLKTADKDTISEVLANLEFYDDILNFVVTPSTFLQKDVTIDKDARAKLYEEASKLNFFKQEFADLRGQLLTSLSEKDGIFDLLKPEKVVSLGARWFRSLGSQNMATVKYMYSLVKKSYNRITLSTNKDLDNLSDLKDNYEKWRKTSGLSEQEALGKIINYEKGTLHSKIDKGFYEARTEAFDSRNKKTIQAFIQENYDTTEYQAWYDKTLADNKTFWNSLTYNEDKVTNQKIINQKIKQFETNFSIAKHPITAFGKHNPKIWSRNFKAEKWQSTEYKELLKTENAPLLEMYNFFIDKNKELADTGAIEEYAAHTFLPNIRKTFADTMNFSNEGFLGKLKDVTSRAYTDFRQKLSVDDYELNNQGARDPFTGEKLEKRFVPYVRHIDSAKKSFDIFALYGLMVKEINKEKYLSENDEVLKALVHIEKSKKTLVSNKYGTLSTKGGKPEISEELGKNAPILVEHVRNVVYGERLQTDSDHIISFRIREKWNKLPVGKMLKFNLKEDTYKPTSISTVKFILWLNTFNQKRILGLNAASAISNLFGGTTSANRIYSKYVSKEDIQRGWTKLTSGAFYQSEDMKKNAALVDYFLPLLSNRENHKASQLSVNQASRILSGEWLMSPMRKTSDWVQLNIFFGVIDNTGLIDGKIVNLREKAAQEVNYSARYSLSATERKAKEVEFKALLKKYKEEYSLNNKAEFKTVTKNGKEHVVLDIPGVPWDSPEIEKVRDIVQTISKDALGEADEFDVANYKFAIIGRLMMTFKNWIPRQADVRFGEFRHDQAHDSHEYGRIRMFYRSLSANYLQTVAKLVPIPYLTGQISKSFSKEDIIKRAVEVYNSKLQKARDLNMYNPKTFISQDEFVEKFIAGSDATFAEFRTLTLLMGLLFFGLAAPDDDDDAQEKGFKALARKQIDKLSDEVGFFYSPKSGIDIAGGGAPVFSVVKDSYNLMTDLGKQWFGVGLESIGYDEKGVSWQESAKPIKRTFKMLPIFKEILTYLPVASEDISKDWGVKINDRRGF